MSPGATHAACTLAGQLRALAPDSARRTPADTPKKPAWNKSCGSQRRLVAEALPIGKLSAIDVGTLRERLPVALSSNGLSAVLKALVDRGAAQRTSASKPYQQYRQYLYYR